MAVVKKKMIQIFSNGSLNFDGTIIKKLKRSKILDRDHTNFSFYRKNLKAVPKQKNLNSFKTKYFRF